ncbi:hypothetical protein B0H19DRAFT_296129 [Mycena capillaripes]|nr:hypothetical protein B0H19DRAFT_296129 [Mycena capillaripes]
MVARWARTSVSYMLHSVVSQVHSTYPICLRVSKQIKSLSLYPACKRTLCVQDWRLKFCVFDSTGWEAILLVDGKTSD